MAGGDVTPSWTRWPFRGIRAGAVIVAVSAVFVAGHEAPGTAVLMFCAAVWPATYPWMWKCAYRLGHEQGRLEALEQLTRAWEILGDVAERMKVEGEA